SSRQIEKLNAEKDRLKRSVKPPRKESERYYRNDKECYPRKDKDHHVALIEEEESDDVIEDDVPSQDIHLAELKHGPLIDKQILLSEGHRIPPTDQIKGKKYCKMHNTFGHHTNTCVHFMDTIQKAIEEGRLIFEEKPKMKVDENPFHVA
ncbi:hypothetical protein A2U01_0038313, partial [Trifolium medium]|nr:hypothetical protein [Trifolium medium]